MTIKEFWIIILSILMLISGFIAACMIPSNWKELSNETSQYEIVEIFYDGYKITATIKDTSLTEIFTDVYVVSGISSCYGYKLLVGKKVYIQKITTQHKKDGTIKVEFKNVVKIC